MSKEFKVGDRVKFGEARGTILAVNVYGNPDYFTIQFDYGKYLIANASSNLKRLKKKAPKVAKVKKTLERWVNVYIDGSTGYPFDSKVDADLFRENDPHRIACVKLVGEYEVDSE